MKVIKASEIKAGMIIGITRGKHKFRDIVLILAKNGFVKVEYTHLGLQDSYGGAMCGTIDGKEQVLVITGKRRKEIFKSIRHDVYDNLHDLEDITNTLNLIRDMDKSLQ